MDMRDTIDYLPGNLSFGCLFGLLCHFLSYFYINATNYDVATHEKSANSTPSITYESACEALYAYARLFSYADHEGANLCGDADHGYNRGPASA